MATPKIPSFASLNQGIVNISSSKATEGLTLPELIPFLPSDARIEAQLPKIYQAKSLELLLANALIPVIKDRDNLTPAVYVNRLKEAKDKFKQLADERRKKKKKGEKDDEADLYEQVVKDFEENEAYQDLLWLLRQVVHIA